VIGGALGGALGGLFFDPIDRWFSSVFSGGGMSRLVGLLAVGLSIGIFVALVERLARDAWLRVRTGPLAGKSFILYKTPTIIGNSPQSDVYLYKDAEIDPSHASIHRVGTSYEIEDMGTRMGTSVGGNKVRRRRLMSGDQIVIGSTILDFEERQKRAPVA
jgi:pSer/pThr/pTyr-binding forkhead associated (FHA) protein